MYRPLVELQVAFNFIAMKLLNYENYELSVTPEALLIGPIRQLFNQDKSQRKEQFYRQLSYLYFMVDPRSTYSYVVDEGERAKMIIKQEGLPADFKPSALLKEAMAIYKEHTKTTSTQLLEDSRLAIEKIRAFLRDVDLTLVDDKGKPIYTVNTIASAIAQMPKLAKDLAETEKVVAGELEEKGRARGGNNKTLLDDGLYFDL